MLKLLQYLRTSASITCFPTPSLFTPAHISLRQAMKEALRYLQKSKADDKDERVASVMQRINLTERFVMARQLITSNAEQSLSICNEVLMSVPTDGQVRRVGDGRHGKVEGEGRANPATPSSHIVLQRGALICASGCTRATPTSLHRFTLYPHTFCYRTWTAVCAWATCTR